MKPTIARALLVFASLLLATVAQAQAPSFDDLQQLHRGGGPAERAPANRPPPSVRPAAGSDSSSGVYYGAIAFTADGSYSTAWKYRTKSEAEAYVATRCSAFGRGECKVIGFMGSLCAGLASFQGNYGGRRYKLAYTGGGTTASQAQQAALNRCNADYKTGGRCQLRTVVCGDGR